MDKNEGTFFFILATRCSIFPDRRSKKGKTQQWGLKVVQPVVFPYNPFGEVFV